MFIVMYAAWSFYVIFPPCQVVIVNKYLFNQVSLVTHLVK